MSQDQPWAGQASRGTGRGPGNTDQRAGCLRPAGLGGGEAGKRGGSPSIVVLLQTPREVAASFAQGGVLSMKHTPSQRHRGGWAPPAPFPSMCKLRPPRSQKSP